MNAKCNKKVRPGVALLVVLFIVMAITILSLGFVTRSDVELACGQNMLLKTQIDYLAESGLEHARGLILNPQDVNDPIYTYWRGGTNLQLISGSDFYEATVDRDESDRCNYIIDCDAYRLEGAEKISLSRLHAELRLDPCIAYWVGSDTTVWPQMTINGDVYCNGTLANNGTIKGDVFAVDMIGNNPEGQEKPTADVGIGWPGLLTSYFGPSYYYIDSTPYTTQLLDPNMTLVPSQEYSAGVYYSVGDVNMPSGVTINSTLVVSGDLIVSGTGNVITAEKNFPALLVTGQMIMEDNASLEINGLAQIGQGISIDSGTADIEVTGGLFINNGGVSDSVTVNVYADPAIASIQIWSASGVLTRWSPAAGAFFRSIERR